MCLNFLTKNVKIFTYFILGILRNQFHILYCLLLIDNWELYSIVKNIASAIVFIGYISEVKNVHFNRVL
jgi:hypothetical protein